MKILECLLDVIAPNKCQVCGREGQLVCAWCLPDAFDEVPSRCFICYKATLNYQTCPKCRKQTPLEQVWVSTVYKNYAKALVKHMKFGPDRSACRLIARWLDDTIPYLEGVTISFVPTSRTRVRVRGFDHAKLIAEEFANLRHLQFEELLEREGKTRQVGSQKTQRIKQTKGVYILKSDKRIPERVIIIDDIVTTGATLSEAARQVKRGGAKHVSAIAFAQTI